MFISIRDSQLDQLDQGPRVVLIRCSCTGLPQFSPNGLSAATGLASFGPFKDEKYKILRE